MYSRRRNMSLARWGEIVELHPINATIQDGSVCIVSSRYRAYSNRAVGVEIEIERVGNMR